MKLQPIPRPKGIQRIQVVCGFWVQVGSNSHSKARRAVGDGDGVIFKVPAFVIYVVGGFWGFFISLAIVTDELGFIGGAIALVLAPFTLTFAPWYAAIADNNWFPVGLVYGGGIAAWICYAIGSAIDGD